MLVPVIMAGGVGSRLWPASREALPKQFLNLSGDAAGLSLFQQSLQRLKGLPDVASPVVVCNAEHRFLVAEQLRQLGIEGATIILEPVGRNTAPAVALAACAAGEHDPRAALLVLAADHVIADVGSFQRAVLAGREQAEQGALVTFGIVADRPETGYGYIQRGAQVGAGYAVARFVEKPDLATATAYLACGEYYWNSGMFMFAAATFQRELQHFAPQIASVCAQAWAGAARDLDFYRIPAEIFAGCPSDSIDYAVMEHTGAGVVLPLDAGWNDLGAWSAVWGHGPQDGDCNVCKGDVLLHDTRNSFVQAESRLVTLVGMDHAIVVETADAVLVAAKDRVQDVKAIVQQLLRAERPEAVLHRKVYRPWGSYEGLAGEAGFQVKRIIVKPGAALSLQLHHQRAEHWIVVRGVATVTRGDERFELTENQSTYIPIGTRHRLENRTAEPLTLIEVQCGGYLGEDDIVRLEDVYGRQD
ncbi:MAG TPA: mannose-1-phosphate guanylyltransferase/mannose-6-phosphate isomerase [Hyphomicrobiales bacterium]|nr:mannose-1-phosphate guanylyltransferase/mannose-6-phosphate isomerase [Hyphomicrobiales bacterium]